MKFGTENVHRNVEGCEFYEDWYSKNHALLVDVNKFYPKFSHLLPNLGDI